MRYDQFLNEVLNRAGVASKEEALVVVRATLETLGERLAGGEPSDAASQLPGEIAEMIAPKDGEAERFDVQAFYRRVADKERSEIETARKHSRIVIDVLKSAVSKGEIDDIRAQLPEDYSPLFVE